MCDNATEDFQGLNEFSIRGYIVPKIQPLSQGLWVFFGPALISEPLTQAPRFSQLN